jgi:hypothetical protein
MNWKDFLKTHQQVLVLTVGYLLVAGLAFGLGRFATPKQSLAPVQNNYNPNQATVQSATITNTTNDCAGQIKGSSSMIYHVPGGAFYERTTHPIRCFETEAQAQAAGFRKSSR